jgi:hypothetical protein
MHKEPVKSLDIKPQHELVESVSDKSNHYLIVITQ